MDLKDSPNERVLNLLTGIEALIMRYVETNPTDKEDAQKTLAYVRKALAGNYLSLPEPKKKTVELTGKAGMQSGPETQSAQQAPIFTWPTGWNSQGGILVPRPRCPRRFLPGW